MTVSFLPVGGYAAVFSLPCGGTMLVDTGDAGHAGQLVKSVRAQMLGDQFVYRFLLFFGWQPRLDWLVISDFSPERTGGLREILENFRVWKIYLPYELNNLLIVQSDRINNLRFLLGMTGRPLLSLSCVDGIELYQDKTGMKFFVLRPVKPQKSVLDSSFCARLVYGGMRFLLSSALTEKDQERLCSYMAEEINADVSYLHDNISGRFLDMVAPVREIRRGEDARFITDGTVLEKI
ncbi:MAG: hypothetical protein ABII20_01705 [Candidatus Omnitrophota bacterium]|nr:hypothetical protein [Candidatus Omnitrophota bacterium]